MKPAGRYEPYSYFQLMEVSLRELLVEKGVVSEDAIAGAMAQMRARGPERGAAMVARAWLDPAYRTRLLADGSAAAEELGFEGSRLSGRQGAGPEAKLAPDRRWPQVERRVELPGPGASDHRRAHEVDVDMVDHGSSSSLVCSSIHSSRFCAVLLRVFDRQSSIASG